MLGCTMSSLWARLNSRYFGISRTCHSTWMGDTLNILLNWSNFFFKNNSSAWTHLVLRWWRLQSEVTFLAGNIALDFHTICEIEWSISRESRSKHGDLSSNLCHTLGTSCHLPSVILRITLWGHSFLCRGGNWDTALPQAPEGVWTNAHVAHGIPDAPHALCFSTCIWLHFPLVLHV